MGGLAIYLSAAAHTRFIRIPYHEVRKIHPSDNVTFHLALKTDLWVQPSILPEIFHSTCHTRTVHMAMYLIDSYTKLLPELKWLNQLSPKLQLTTTHDSIQSSDIPSFSMIYFDLFLAVLICLVILLTWIRSWSQLEVRCYSVIPLLSDTLLKDLGLIK